MRASNLFKYSDLSPRTVIGHFSDHSFHSVNYTNT